MSVGEKPIVSRLSRRLFWLPVCLLFCLVAAGFFGCADERRAEVTSASDERSDCTGCHADKAMIVATAVEDTTSSGDDTGES